MLVCQDTTQKMYLKSLVLRLSGGPLEAHDLGNHCPKLNALPESYSCFIPVEVAIWEVDTEK